MSENTIAESTGVEAKSHFLSKITDDAGKVIANEFREYGALAEKWFADRNSYGDSLSADETTRDDLFEAAKLGLLTNVSAEALATQLNCGSLARKPDYDDFKPMGIADWTLTMAVAWIATRDVNAVIKEIAEFRKDWFVWHTIQNLGVPKDGKANGYVIKTSYVTEQICPSNLDYMAFGDRTFEKVLWGKLSEGELSATGKRNGNSRQNIPPELWQDLEPYNRVNAYLRGAGEEWHDVTVRRDDVLRLWPKKLPLKQAQQKRQAVSNAIAQLTRSELEPLSQKVRESRIMSHVSGNAGLAVSDRYVRKIWAKSV